MQQIEIPDRRQSEKTEHNFCDVPVKDIYTESNHKETSDKPKMRNILEEEAGEEKEEEEGAEEEEEEKLACVYKNVNVMKDKERLKKYSRLKEIVKHNN